MHKVSHGNSKTNRMQFINKSCSNAKFIVYYSVFTLQVIKVGFYVWHGHLMEESWHQVVKQERLVNHQNDPNENNCFFYIQQPFYSETPLLCEFHYYANIQKGRIFSFFIFVKITSLLREFRTTCIHYNASFR